MANQKNQVISVPLSSPLNFSKIKTNVTQYNGFNDLNSPIYGDTLSPLYAAERETRSPGNARPYVDKNKILRDKDGKQLLDLKGYKGVKRTELKDIPSIALAVRDAEHYIVVNEDQGYTAIYQGKDDSGTSIVKTVPFEATAAAYSEAEYNLLFLTEKGYLHIYNADTLKPLASAQSVDNVRAIIHTFYDPLNKWHVISIHEPFGSWDYHKEAKKTTITESWKRWQNDKIRLGNDLRDSKDNASSSRDKYRRYKQDYNNLVAQRDANEQQRQQEEHNADVYYGLGWGFSWLLWAGHEYFNGYRAAKKKAAEAASRRDYYQGRINTWARDHGGTLDDFYNAWQVYEQRVEKISAELTNHIASEPAKYGNNPDNPNYFYGKIGPSFNFLYDAASNTLVRKHINIPWKDLNKYSDGPSADSYIITGIYDVGLKSSNGKWQKNTDDDFIRYRLGVIPYSMGNEDQTNVSLNTSSKEYYFMLNYSPKIHFRKHNINEAWNISTDIPNETKTYLTNYKQDGDYYQKSTAKDIFFTGTGEYGTNPIWGKVVFEPKEKNTTDNPKGISAGHFDFNLWDCIHDFGGAPYTMYSPWARYETGNCFNDSGIKREITKDCINYDLCSSYLYYNIPTEGGEEITLKPEPKNIFREVINNNAKANISVTEDKYSIGTFMETPNSIDGMTPTYYKYGRDGGSIVYKTEYGQWIECTVTDEISDIKVLNNDYVIVYTTSPANCIRLKDGKIKHWSPDWNNRFSLVGSPYPKALMPMTFPASSSVVNTYKKSSIVIASAINPRFEATNDPITGYAANRIMINSNEDNITFIGFISKYDKIDVYFKDFIISADDTPAYYKSMDSSFSNFSLFGDTQLEGTTYPSGTTNIPGLFCKIKPSNFGRFYLEDGNIFYNLIIYNGKIFYCYDTSSGIDDVKELFMVQGQTFAITKSNYLYSVFISQNGTASMTDALINIEGLQFCGAIPEMAIFYSPMDRTLKSFTADHILKDIQQATLIDNVYYTAYNPQTSSIYICTNNGIYVYSANNQYKLQIRNVKEIYFGGSENKHTYIVYDKPIFNDDTTATEVQFESKTIDYVFDRGYRESDETFTSTDFGADYKLQPVVLETRYYGAGNNGVTITDCVYFRLFSNIGPIDTTLKIKERSITDNVYTKAEKELKISKDDWDEETNTCYVRYQPKNQRSVGLSIHVESACAISEIVFSTSPVDTIASSKPRLSM